MGEVSELWRIREQIAQKARETNYRGYDPYDGLLSPLARLPLLRRMFLWRWGWQQLVKRLPASARPFLGIPPQENSKALALFLEGWLDGPSGPEQAQEVQRLSRRIWNHFHKDILWGWGYPFPWQSRLFFLPAGAPNTVVTAFVLLALSRMSAQEPLFPVAESLWSLRQMGSTGPFIPYAPQSKVFVPNVTALAAWAFARIGSRSNRTLWITWAQELAHTVARAQNPDGSWPYATYPGMEWVDNFHTGYVLVSLHEVGRIAGDPALLTAAQKGYRFWRDHFWDEEGHLKGGTVRNPGPPDVHDYTQAVETLLTFSEKDEARRVAGEMVRELWDPRRWCFWKNIRHRSCYIRWGQAWAFKALSRLLRVLSS